MEDQRPKFSVIAIILPAALALSSACILLLTVQSASLSTLRSENDRETSRQAELSAALKVIRDQVEPAKKELASLLAEQGRLAEERKAALETISRAGALSQVVEQLRKDEAALSRRIDDLRKVLTEVSERLDSSRSAHLALERKLEQVRADKTDAESRLADVSAKESAASQRLAERERVISARDKIIAEKDKALAERDSEIGAVTGLLRRLEAQKKQIEGEISERRSEAKAIADQLAGLEREKVNLTELQRLRSERTDLIARLDGSRQELKVVEAAIREKESLRQELERTLGDLLAKRAAAEAAARKQ